MSDLIYEELHPRIEEGLKKFEKNAPLENWKRQLKTAEVSIQIFKNGEKRTISKELCQRKWSWSVFAASLSFAFGGLSTSRLLAVVAVGGYCLYHFHGLIYSREKAERLIQRSVQELILSEGLAKDEVLQCAIKVKTSDLMYSRTSLPRLVESSESLCSHTFKVVEIIIH